MKKFFYTIYKKNGDDIYPICQFENSQDVKKYLKVHDREFRKIIANSKRIWFNQKQINSKILIFKDAK